MENEPFLFVNESVEASRILYTPSNFARSALLYLQEIGTLRLLSPHSAKRGGLNSALFFIVRAGHGCVEYGGHQYNLSAGDCVFIDCHNAYVQSSLDDPWTISWVHFYGVTLPQVYEKYCGRGGLPVFRSSHVEAYLEIFEELYKCASSESYIRDMEINESLARLLRLLMEASWHPENRRVFTSRQLDVRGVRDYLSEHYTERLTLDELSRIFFIDKFYLAKSFKRKYGVAINTYLQDLRITEAKRLLRFTAYSLEQVGGMVGWPDVNYFIRVFKKVEGVTPGMYRRLW